MTELKPSLSVMSLLGETSIIVCDGNSTVRIHLYPKGVRQLIEELQHSLALADDDDYVSPEQQKQNDAMERGDYLRDRAKDERAAR